MESNLTPTAEFKQALLLFSKCSSNEELKQLELIITNFINKNPNSIEEITKILKEENNPSIAQLLSILLKKSIKKNYFKLENKEKVLEELWNLVIKYEGNSQLLIQFSHGLGLIYKSENKKISDSPEIVNFLSSYLNFTNKQQFLTAMIVLQNLIDFCPSFFSNEQIKELVTKIRTVFASSYNPDQNDIYVYSLKSLFVFFKSFLNDDFYDVKEIYEYLLTLLQTASGLLKNEDFIFEERNAMEDVLINFFDDLGDNIEIVNPKLSKESVKLVLDFVLSDSLLNNDHLDNNVKCSCIEILGVINYSYKGFYNPKLCKMNYLEKTLDIYVKMLEKEFLESEEKIKNGVETKLHNFLSEKLSRLIFMSIDSLVMDLRTKNIFAIISKVRKYFFQKKQHKNLLMLLSATVEQFSLFYLKEIDFLVKEVLLPCLASDREDIVLYALRTLCFFSEYLMPNILDFEQEFLDVFIKFLSQENFQKSDEYTNRVQIAIVEQTLYAMELIVENMESENLAEKSIPLLTNIINVINEKNLNDTTKKVAIGTLSSVFSTTSSEELYKNLGKFLEILNPFLSNEFLLGEVLRCLGKLSYYCLKDIPECDKVYRIYFEVYLTKSLEVANNLNTTIFDFEVYEGALTIIYNCIDLLKRRSSFMFNKELFYKWLAYIDDARLDDLNEPEDEKLFEEEKKNDNVNMIAQLPFVYMVSAGLKFIGSCVRYFPDLIFENDEQFFKVKNFLAIKILSDHVDERFQAFCANIKYVLGVFEFMNKNLAEDVFVILETVTNNESSDSNLQRCFSEFRDFVLDLGEIANGNVVFEDPNFLKKLSFIINVFLKNQYDDQLNPDLYMEISLLITEMAKVCKGDSCMEFVKDIYPCITYPGDHSDDFDLEVIEEMYGSLAEIINYYPPSLSVFLNNFDQNNQFQNFVLKSQFYDDEPVARNGMFLLGEIFDKIRLPCWANQNQLTHLLNVINDTYTKSEMPELKDNCVSAVVKFYLNSDYKALVNELLNDEKVFKMVCDILPLKGDTEESSSLLKALLYFLNFDQFGQKILNDTKLILFVVTCLVDKELKIDDTVKSEMVLRLKQNMQVGCVLSVLNSLDQNSQTALKSILESN